MKISRLFGVAFATLFILVMASTPALAGLSLTLAGSSFPLRVSVTLLGVATKLTSASGVAAEGVGFLLLLLASSATNLGTFEALFTKVKVGETAECKSEGDPQGEVLSKGTYITVYTSLSPLTSGNLAIISPLNVTCGATEVEIRGTVLASINPASIGTEGTELVSALGSLKGNGKGRPSVRTYYNKGGTAVQAKLEAELGVGFIEAAEEIEAEVTVLAAKTNMVLITGR
jgi:hypothetical protein